MSSAFKKGQRGQATIEAAFALPVLMVLVLLLLQPGIVLYDRVVMAGAAAEGCRLLTTASDSDAQHCHDYVMRRLSAVPQADIFHVHSTGCTWDVQLEGDEVARTVTVRITTEAKPLPLIDCALGLLGLCNERGNVVIEVEATSATQPDWVDGQVSPDDWIRQWV